VNTGSRFSRGAVGTLAVLMTTALLAGCGVSQSKYTAMTKERDDLTVKNKELQTNLDQTTKAKADLQAQMDAQTTELNGKVQELEAAKQKVEAENADVKQTYETMMGHMQSELNSGKIEIEHMRDGINVNLAQDILFKSGSADLDKTGKELLLKVAQDLKTSAFQVVVVGHTDNQKIGKALAARYPSNWELGGARAATIVRLFEDAGIAKERLTAASFADSRPRESNDTPEGRMKNRRIEIKLRPIVVEQAAQQ